MPGDILTTETTQDVVTDLPAAAQDETADDFDKDRALALIRKLRQSEKEAKAKLARLHELETAEQQRADQELSAAQKAAKDAEQLRAQLAQVEAELRRAKLKDAVQEAAQKLQVGFADGALNDALALGVFADVDVNDRGDVIGVNEAIKALQKSRPYLFRSAAASGAPNINAGARSASPTGLNDEERKQARDRYRQTF